MIFRIDKIFLETEPHSEINDAIAARSTAGTEEEGI
jgi:hypothetical protein